VPDPEFPPPGRGCYSETVEGGAEQVRRVVVVDDSPLQCAIWRALLEERYPDRARVETYTDPTEAVPELGPDIHLLLVDWEMPGIDGQAVVEEARCRGVNLKRIIISSAHPADRLHQVFDQTGCLAVIEKEEPAQQAALLMILDSIMKR
jgi:CheY-like chemotaxis protein